MINFSDKAKKEIEALVVRYPQKQAALLPVLWIAQKEFQELTPEVRRLVADTLEISLAHVEGVIGFYTMYTTEKRGKYHLALCRNLSCALNGYEEIRHAIESETGLKPGETSSDGRFTFTLAECLGSCGTAPVMQVNLNPYNENLTPQSVRDLIRQMKESRV